MRKRRTEEEQKGKQERKAQAALVADIEAPNTILTGSSRLPSNLSSPTPHSSINPPTLSASPPPKAPTVKTPGESDNFRSGAKTGGMVTLPKFNAKGELIGKGSTSSSGGGAQVTRPSSRSASRSPDRTQTTIPWVAAAPPFTTPTPSTSLQLLPANADTNNKGRGAQEGGGSGGGGRRNGGSGGTQKRKSELPKGGGYKNSRT